MDTEAPPWTHMLARMAAVGCRTAQGAVRFRDPDRTDAFGEPAEGGYRFWYAAPHGWRVEDDDGVYHVQDDEWVHVRGASGLMQRMPRQDTAWGFHFGHPWTLLGADYGYRPRFTDPEDFSVPLRPGKAVTVAGRPGWEFVLAPPARKPHPLRLVLDDETGVVLRMSVPELATYVEMTQFTTDVDISSDLFKWQGPIDTTLLDERVAEESMRRWLNEQKLPVPRWWPGGLPYSANEGDPETGAFLIDLTVPGYPSLCRWPAGGTPPDRWLTRTEGRHVHEWTEGPWRWALAVTEPLDAVDLDRVVSSIRAGD